MSRYVKVGLENATYGSGTPASATAGLLVTSVGDPVDRAPIIEECISGYVANSAYGGALRIKGTLEGSLRPVQMKPLFNALFGTATPGEGVTTYTLGMPKSLVMEVGEQVSDTLSMETKYKGVGISGCTLEFNPKEIVTARFDWVAKNFVNGSFSAPASYTTEDPVVFYNAVISIGGTPTTTVKSLSLSVDRKLDEEQYTLGAFDLQRLTINGMTDITGELTFSEMEYTQYKAAMTGNSAQTSIAENNPLGTVALTITCTDMSNPGVTNLVISMPVTVYTDTDRTIQGMNEIEKKVKFRVVGSGFSLAVTE